MAIPLLSTKLYIPKPRPGHVNRPRLLQRLQSGLSGKLTLVSAPAGFGKTTLLSECVPNCERPVAWISLDQGDNDPIRFLSYFITALQKIDDGIGRDILNSIQSTNPHPMEMVLTRVINQITEIHQPFILVLDDFHVISDPKVQAAVTFAIENLPPKMHIIIATRADPPWPLARLRARGDMTEIRADHLRFTADETRLFLNGVMELSLSEEDVNLLEARTEGWIAGLQMASISMRGHEDISGFIRSFNASNRFILDYLMEEVLKRQPENIQQFLLSTSILERLTTPLCNAVTGQDDGENLLQHLEHSNLFLLPLDDERLWYRYHHLFADSLRNRLEQQQPEAITSLHLRASKWYEKSGLVAEAVNHALAASDFNRVANLVEGNALSMMGYGELTTLEEWLQVLPEEIVRSHPWINVTYGWTGVYTGQLEAVEPFLQIAESTLADASHEPIPDEEQERITGHITAIRAYVAELNGDLLQAESYARKALTHLPKDDLMARGSAATVLGAALRWNGDFEGAKRALIEASDISRAAGNNHIAIFIRSGFAQLKVYQGRLREAAADFEETLQISRANLQPGGRRSPVTGYIYTRLSWILREWNDLETALRYARAGLELSKQWGQADVLVYGYANFSRALLVSGDVDEAINTIQAARQVADDVSPWFGGLAAAWDAQTRLASGNLEAASVWLQNCGLNINDEPSFIHEEEYMTMARVLIAQGKAGDAERLDKALNLLARLKKMTETAGANSSLIEILVLQAILLQNQNKVEQALDTLSRALALGEPEGFVRTFIDEGQPMVELLLSMIRLSPAGTSMDYANKLLTTMRGEIEVARDDIGRTKVSPIHSSSTQIVDMLSDREMEVLRLLATNLTSTEIADELYISSSTVRTHVKNIYSKLDVHRRYDAVQRGKDLGLI